MKKKNSFVKKLIALVLVVGILGVIIFALRQNSKNNVKVVIPPELPVITYFGITDESTTEADIIKVEERLNGMLITNGYALKLFLAPEDRYDTMVESAKAVIDAYKENAENDNYGFKYSFDYATSTFSYECSENTESVYTLYNRDTIRWCYDEGRSIEPNVLSMDVVLYTDFDDYYADASDGKLLSLAKALNDANGQMISLNKAIPAQFFDAVKVGDTTESAVVYGIPSVRAVGQYEFMVFDQAYLDHYSQLIMAAAEADGEYENGFSKYQMSTVNDIEGYLRYVKANAGPDGEYPIPLLNAPTTPPIELMEGNGLGVTSNGELLLPFKNIAYCNFYATIAKYRSLDYLVGAVAKDAVGESILSEDFAVAFYAGTMAEMESIVKQAAEGEDGKELVYSIYAYPKATSEEICEAVYAIYNTSGYGNDDYESYAVNFLRLLNSQSTDVDVKNVLFYGVIGEHYTLTNSGEVITKVDVTYSMDNKYTGHTFHALVSNDKGISEDSIKADIAHNLDLTTSQFTGFNLATKTFAVKDPEGNSILIDSVDYLNELNSIVAEFYDSYINGILFEFDATSDEYKAQVSGQIEQRLKANLLSEYKIVFEQGKKIDLREEVLADETFMTAKREDAVLLAAETVKANTRQAMIDEYRKGQEAMGAVIDETWAPSEEDVTAAVEAEIYYTAEDEAKIVEEELAGYVTVQVNKLFSEYVDSLEYETLMNAYLQSDEYKALFDERLVEDYDDLFAANLANELSSQIYDTFGSELVEKISARFAEANAARVAEIARDYPFVDVSELAFYDYSQVLANIFCQQYYDLKGQPK